MFASRFRFPKYVLTLAALGFMIHGTARAQTSIMVSGGLTRTNLDVTCGEDADELPFPCDLLVALFGTSTGIHTGVDVTRDLSPYFGVRVATGFYRRGWMAEGVEGVGQDVDYIDFGVLAKVSPVPQTGLFSVYGLAGPYAGFLVNCTEWEGEATAACGEQGFADVESTDFGLVFGAGLAATRGRTNFVLEWLYGLGLASVWSEPLEGLDTARNRGFAVRAGVEYRIR